MRLSLDSTDSIQGGCTTFVALEIWSRLSEFETLGAPRLVRLNPNIPFKTRGNGALCLDLGHAVGRRSTVGHHRGSDLRAAGRIEAPTVGETERIFRVACQTIEELRSPLSTEAESGVALFERAPPEPIYRETVRRFVTRSEAADWIGCATYHRRWAGGRGLIGAVAAAAWPARNGTYELIAYRRPSAVGTKRRIDSDLGPRLDGRYPSTFDNWDPRHRHLRIVPRSPCPVLAGIRGTRPSELLRARRELGPEPHESWLLFATNQATGDHLEPKAIASARPYDSVVIDGTVTAPPEAGRGGHTFVDVHDGTGGLRAIAYEPTKEFRIKVRELRTGDRVRLEGGIHRDPGVLALEAVEFLEVAPLFSVRPPTCDACGRKGKSRGRRAGYRCPSCHRAFAPQESVVRFSRRNGLGRFTVPIAVRRHLSRPNDLTADRLVLAPMPEGSP